MRVTASNSNRADRLCCAGPWSRSRAPRGRSARLAPRLGDRHDY